MSDDDKIEVSEIEGLDDDNGGGLGDYPIDTVLIRHETRTVFEIIRRIHQGLFVMNPDFQRDFIWEGDKQSKLIESVLLRIPLPVFYLAEDSYGRLVVVDGLQRLSTFRDFFANKLRLALPSRKDLHGKTFDELPSKLKSRIEDCNLILYVIDAKVQEKVRLDIFDRVNAGIPLTRQQMRNCLYSGPATRFLWEEANTDLFKQATGNSLRSNMMRDREFINRFCAFQLLGYSSFRSEFDEFLADALKKMNELPAPELAALSKQFRLGLQNNVAVFSQHAFRKRRSQTSGRLPLNVSLWDVMSTGLSRYPHDVVLEQKNNLERRFEDLLNDDGFVAAITSSTNDPKKVKYRFETSKQMLREVLGDPSA
ncbi:MAG: DUF262 domain-containing protein [Myxococcales bacterium]|nr:DUF262 domain-containing protein [Myxococcales bacterium]